MKKLILGLAAVALTVVLTSCVQNFKDNELIVENKTAGNLTFDFRGESYDVAAGKVMTITKIDRNKEGYPYAIVVDGIPSIVEGVKVTSVSAGDLKGTLVYENTGGWRNRMKVVGLFSSLKSDTTAPEPLKQSGVYEISSQSTGGWVE